MSDVGRCSQTFTQCIVHTKNRFVKIHGSMIGSIYNIEETPLFSSTFKE